jgi:hypothetical protein
MAETVRRLSIQILPAFKPVAGIGWLVAGIMARTAQIRNRWWDMAPARVATRANPLSFAAPSQCCAIPGLVKP